MLYVNIENGEAVQCYYSRRRQNIFKNLNRPIKFIPIGKCKDFHCYNGHALLTLGLIPNLTNTRYGDIRNRQCLDGSEWLQPELKEFFNCQLKDNNKEYSKLKKATVRVKNVFFGVNDLSRRAVRKIFRKKQKNNKVT